MPIDCPACHSLNPDAAIGCQQCGTSLMAVPPARPSRLSPRPTPPRSDVFRERIYTVLGVLMMASLVAAGAFQVKKYLATWEMKHQQQVEQPAPVSPEVRTASPAVVYSRQPSPNGDGRRDAEEMSRQLALQQQKQQELEAQNRALDDQNRRAREEREQALRQQQAQLQEQQQRAEAAQRQAEDARAQLNAEQERRAEEERKRASLERERASVYTGPLSGSLIWTGTAKKGEEITIAGDHADSGNVSGSLPGVMVGVDVAPEMKGKVQIVFAPSRTNNFRLVSFRVLKGGGSMTVKILWNRP